MGVFGSQLSSASPTDMVCTLAAVDLTSASANYGATEELSGALTADTYSAALLDITGSGTIHVLYLESVDATARTVSLQLTIDGNIVYDGGVATSGGDSGLILVPIGKATAQAGGMPLNYNEDFSVKIKSTITETDKLTLGYRYNVVT